MASMDTYIDKGMAGKVSMDGHRNCGIHSEAGKVTIHGLSMAGYSN